MNNIDSIFSSSSHEDLMKAMMETSIMFLTSNTLSNTLRDAIIDWYNRSKEELHLIDTDLFNALTKEIDKKRKSPMAFDKITQTLYNCTSRLYTNCTVCPYGELGILDKQADISALNDAAIILLRNTIVKPDYCKKLIDKSWSPDNTGESVVTCKEFLEELSDAVYKAAAASKENEDRFPFEAGDIVKMSSRHSDIFIISRDDEENKNIVFLGYKKKKGIGRKSTIKTERYTYYFTHIDSISYRYDGRYENK